jgi:alkanesulfonate monooxygenase SsuD/methylene tetrahydromethanopterin reductase-like flavin-dependent oxidoreductase (luciferase family)
MTSIPISMMFDMRAPEWATPAPELYAAALDMAAFADEIGIQRIGLMEHHGSDDGYLPQPFVMGGGFAARTRRCAITLGAVILPLHDPVELAEQIAVLDQMSNGRLQVTLGAGYVAWEFQAFRAALKDRAKRLDEGIEIILRALNGERFQAGGREIFVRPLPVQRPEDILLVGGGVEASARRAARFGLGFSPMGPHLFDVYDAECRRLGREPGRKIGGAGPLGIHLSRDPERGWAQLMPHLKHMVSEYAKWAEQEPGSNSPFLGLADNEAALRACGLFAVWTPEELVERAPQMAGENRPFSFMPLVGGLAPAIAWESLELLKSVAPRLAAATT